MSYQAAFPLDIVGNAVSTATELATQTILRKPIANYNDFMDKVGKAISPTRAAGNVYAKQDMLQLLSNRGDPLLSFDWIGVVINTQGLSTNYSLPWYYIDEIHLPPLTSNTHTRRINGLEKNYVSDYNPLQSQIKLYTDNTGMAFNFANQWLRSAYRTDKFFGLPASYKKDVQIYILDPARQCVADFRLKGCFPSTWDGYQLGAASTPLDTTLTLCVDEVLQNYDSDLSTAKDAVNTFFSGLTNPALNTLAKTVNGAAGSLLSSLFSPMLDK